MIEPAPLAIADASLQISEDQARALALPFGMNMNARGGRAGKKTSTIILRILQRIQHFPTADHIVIRGEHDQLTSLAREFERFARLVFGVDRVTSVMKPPMLVRVHTGTDIARTDFRIYDESNPSAEGSWRGSNYSGALIDDIALYTRPDVMVDIGPCLRQGSIPVELWLTQNPETRARWLDPWNDHPDFEPFIDEFGRPWVTWLTDFRSNPFIDREAMFAALKHKLKIDPAAGRSWFTGEASAGLDYFFSVCYSPKRSRVPQWTSVPKFGWSRAQLSIDVGGTAPSVAYLFCKALNTCVGGDDQIYPKGSLVLLDECDTCIPEQLQQTFTQTVDGFVNECIFPMTDHWNITRPSGILDDASFSMHGHQQSLADLFTAAGCAVRPARKGRRVDGLARMRGLMANAMPNGERTEAGFYHTPACRNFELTIPGIRTNPRLTEDHMSDGDDHWADAARYAVQARTTETKILELRL